MANIERCTCGNGEAEEDRGAVLRCSVHGFEARTQQALRVAAEAVPCPNCAGAVEERDRLLEAIQEFLVGRVLNENGHFNDERLEALYRVIKPADVAE